MDTMLECVRMSHSNAWSKDPMMQLKITALLSPELCVRLPNQSPQSLILLFFRTDAWGDFKLFFFEWEGRWSHFWVFWMYGNWGVNIRGFKYVGKKIRTHISEFGVSTAVPGCSWMCKPCSPYLSALPVFIQFWHCLFPENVRVVLKVKLTNIIRQQPYNLNLLIRSMDGEVSPQFNKWSSFLGVTFQFPYKEVLPKIVSFSQSASPV